MNLYCWKRQDQSKRLRCQQDHRSDCVILRERVSRDATLQEAVASVANIELERAIELIALGALVSAITTLVSRVDAASILFYKVQIVVVCSVHPTVLV